MSKAKRTGKQTKATAKTTKAPAQNGGIESVQAQLHALMRRLGKFTVGRSKKDRPLTSDILIYPQISEPASGSEYSVSSGGSTSITLSIDTNDPSTTHEAAYAPAEDPTSLTVVGDVTFPYFSGVYWTPGSISVTLSEGDWVLVCRVKDDDGENPVSQIIVSVSDPPPVPPVPPVPPAPPVPPVPPPPM